MRTKTKQVLTLLIIAILTWPIGFYSRPYPAFGGESLFVIAAGLALVGQLLTKKEEE